MNRARARLTGYAIAVGLVIAGIAVVGIASEHANEQTRTCTVTSKDRTTDREGRSDARIYTEQCGTLQTGDMLTRGQFNSADIYSAIEPDHTYEMTTVGWRVGILSTFPKIIGTPTEVTS